MSEQLRPSAMAAGLEAGQGPALSVTLRLIPRESDTIALKQDVGVENFVNLGFSNVVKVENC